MANVGECLYIAAQITPGDRDSWYQQWSGFADKLGQQADTALAAGHQVSARGCYLRAAEYYRQAFFWHRDNLDAAELHTAYEGSVRAFRNALPLLGPPGVVLDGDTPGYLFLPPGAGPFPTILHIGGYDGTAERTSRRPARRLTEVGHSSPSTVRVREAHCMSDASPCAPTGSTSCPGWSTS